MDLYNLNSINQTDVEQARDTIINMIKSDPKYQNLDLSPGTVLYDLLLRPASELYALQTLQFNFAQMARSLQTMADSGEVIDPAYVNAILSNFSMAMITGDKASGIVLVKVSKDHEYTIPTGTTFTDSFGLNFLTYADVTVSNRPLTGQTVLTLASDGNYFFLLNVIAEDYGTKYLLTQGTRLNTSINLFDFISAEAYADFSGAAPAETINDLIARIPAAISNRGLESRISISASLTSPENGNFTNIRALSIVGAGDDGQLRDKHNTIGGSMFGRVDIYPRTFYTPTVVTLSKTGTRIAPGIYSISISKDDAPGFYAIKSVTDAESVVAPLFSFNTLLAVGSYAFTETREASGLVDIPHDISLTNSVIETAFTCYQSATLLVTSVTTVPVENHPFKVELYCAPSIKDIQDYVDRVDIRNVKADYLVRAPLICMVSLRAAIDIDTNSTLTETTIKDALVSYINNKSFVAKLTQSEIIGVITALNVKDVDLSSSSTTGFKMQGNIRSADGTVVTLNGPSLNIGDKSDATTLLLPSTTVFGITATDISITLRKV